MDLKPLAAQEVEDLKTSLRSHGLGILAIEEEMLRWHRQLEHADSVGAIVDPTWYRSNMEQIGRWSRILPKFLAVAAAVREAMDRDVEIIGRQHGS